MKNLPLKILKGLLPALVLLSTQPAFAQKNKITLIDKFVIAKAKYHGFNGNVLVAEKGRIIYQKSLGFSQFKQRHSSRAKAFSISPLLAKSSPLRL